MAGRSRVGLRAARPGARGGGILRVALCTRAWGGGCGAGYTGGAGYTAGAAALPGAGSTLCPLSCGAAGGALRVQSRRCELLASFALPTPSRGGMLRPLLHGGAGGDAWAPACPGGVFAPCSGLQAGGYTGDLAGGVSHAGLQAEVHSECCPHAVGLCTEFSCRGNRRQVFARGALHAWLRGLQVGVARRGFHPLLQAKGPLRQALPGPACAGRAALVRAPLCFRLRCCRCPAYISSPMVPRPCAQNRQKATTR